MNTINFLNRVFLIFVLIAVLQLILLNKKSFAQTQWGTFYVPSFNGVIVGIDFLNIDTGFVAVQNSATDTIAILRTMNKGITFDTIWKYKSASTNHEISIDFQNASTGLISFDDFVYQIENGLTAHCLTFPGKNYRHKIKILENGIGYCLFSTLPQFTARNYIYKTTNYGLNWTNVFNENIGGTIMEFNDIAIKADSPNIATVVGTITNLSGGHLFPVPAESPAL